MKLATLLPGSNLIELGHSEIWKGHIVTSNGSICPAYTKLVDERTLSIELICALIGRELSLPIPQPYLVRVPTQTISSVTSETIAFALEEVSYPSISTTIREDKFIKEKVLKWEHIIQCAAFDTWIGNSDRIPHNLLYDGKYSFQMIDHGDALPSFMSAETSTQNKLMQYLKEENNTEFSRQSVLKTLLQEAEKFHNVDLADIHRRIVKSNGEIPSETVEKILNILHSRLNYLSDIFKTQLDIKQRDFIYDTPSEKSGKKGSL